MKTFADKQPDYFFYILIFSFSIHLLILNRGQVNQQYPDFSVLQAPNSMEVQLVEEINTLPIPVKTSKEDVVWVKHSENVVLESFPVSETEKILPVSKKVNNNETPEKIVHTQKQSIPELKGALTQARPLADINPAPRYPYLAQRQEWEGTVYLSILINPEGLVHKLKVNQTSGHKVLDAAAVKAVQTWKFVPAREGSKAVSSSIVLPVEFRLSN